MIDFTHGPRAEAGTGAQRDNTAHHFQAHNELSLPEGPRGHCWDQPVSSRLIKEKNKVAACEMLMVLLKIMLCF